MVHDDWMMTEGMPRAYDLGKPQLLLVGGFNPSEKYWSMGRIIPYIIEKMFETTSLRLIWYDIMKYVIIMHNILVQ